MIEYIRLLQSFFLTNAQPNIRHKNMHPTIIVAVASTAYINCSSVAVVKYYVNGEFDAQEGPAPYNIVAAYNNIVIVGRRAFPFYDSVLSSDSHASDQQINRVFGVLSRLKADCSSYISPARRLALSNRVEVRATSIQFLASHGDKSDVKLAIAFLAVGDNDITWACLDVLARFGGRDDADLTRAVLTAQKLWSDKTRDHAHACLVTMERRFAAEAKKPLAKP